MFFSSNPHAFPQRQKFVLKRGQIKITVVRKMERRYLTKFNEHIKNGQLIVSFLTNCNHSIKTFDWNIVCLQIRLNSCEYLNNYYKRNATV